MSSITYYSHKNHRTQKQTWKYGMFQAIAKDCRARSIRIAYHLYLSSL